MSTIVESGAVLAKSMDGVSLKTDEESVIVPIRETVGDIGCIRTMSGVASAIWDLVDGEVFKPRMPQALLPPQGGGRSDPRCAVPMRL